MSHTSPGLYADRLIRLMRESIARCDLNLNGLTVLTEAATGAYVITPLLAAMAGAPEVYAIAKASRFGSVDDVVDHTYDLARKIGVDRAITIIGNATPAILEKTDILTNSGHVRPITAAVISHLKSGAVVPLMYENWEFRESDLDLEACHGRGIRVGGTNERHPAIGVFEFLGIMAVKLLLDAGIAVYKSKILLICDNDFGAYIETGLRSAGAYIQCHPHVPKEPAMLDAVMIAATPREESVLTRDEIQRIALHSPGAVIAQFYGDLDRQVLTQYGIPVCPERAPEKGHMGILPSAVGPEPIIRLQTGGLKAGEVLHSGRFVHGDLHAQFVELLWPKAMNDSA
jgi:hypothetical protein